MDKKTFPVAGYSKTGGMQIFDLAIGEKLPEGFADRPFVGQHPHDAEQGRTAAALGIDAVADALGKGKGKAKLPGRGDD